MRESGKLNQQSKGHTAEGADDPLTLADTSSHKEMVRALKQAWPKMHIVSEEVAILRPFATPRHVTQHADPAEHTANPNLNLYSDMSPHVVNIDDVTGLVRVVRGQSG